MKIPHPVVSEWARRFFRRPPNSSVSPLYQFAGTRPGKVALVVVLGRDPAALARFVPAAETRLRRFARRIYLTDSDDLRPFTMAGAVVEVMPRPADLTGPADPVVVQSYLWHRYSLILAKWEPTIVLNYGTTIENLLSEIGVGTESQEDVF